MKNLLRAGAVFAMAVTVLSSCGTKTPEKKYDPAAVRARAIEASIKQNEDEGYKPVGAGSLEMYLIDAIDKKLAVDDKGANKYMVVEGESNGGAYDAVSEDAWSSAKVKIAGNIETYVVGLIKRQTANNKLNQEQAITLSKYVGANKQVIAQKVSTSDIYYFKKDLPGGQMRIKYAGYLDYSLVAKAAKAQLKQELQGESDELSDELDILFPTK
ncbi:MAG: hypothetical protein KAG37_03645 [Flavobacteriales bacterium]|nr:hypothetical protein [Flavobacteriales bacterium]